MAKFFPVEGDAQEVPTPLTLTALQGYVVGWINFIELSSGDVLVVNEMADGWTPMNINATYILGFPVYGNVVLCSPSEIA